MATPNKIFKVPVVLQCFYNVDIQAKDGDKASDKARKLTAGQVRDLGEYVSTAVWAGKGQATRKRSAKRARK
jgi:hypothetical protein